MVPWHRSSAFIRHSFQFWPVSSFKSTKSYRPLIFGQNSFKVLIFNSIDISFIGFYSIECNSSLFVVASIGFTRLDRLNRVLSMSWFSK